MAPPSADTSVSSLLEEIEPWRASSKTRVQFQDDELVPKRKPKVENVGSKQQLGTGEKPATSAPKRTRAALTSKRDNTKARKRVASKTKKSAPKTLSFRDPEINWTVADFFWEMGPRSYLTYHVVSTPYYMFGPMGAVAGVMGHGILRQRSSSSLSSSSFLGAATGSCMVAGVGGAVLGLSGLLVSSLRGSKAKPIPFNEDGIYERVLKLSRCVSIRVLDRAVWTCVFWTTMISLGASALSKAQSRDSLLQGLVLRPLMQGVSLGSCVGSFLGLFHLSRLATMDEEAVAQTKSNVS